MSNQYVKNIVLAATFSVCLFACSVIAAQAATLSVSPSTGVYQAGNTFTTRVVVNTTGDPINAADATLTFDPNQLSVVSANRSGSIFGLWVTEPTFSNAAGTVSFSGGSPSGYTGSAGTIMNVTFRAKAAGTARISFTSGSVLANDGRGTNVLTAMNGGTYTIQAVTAEPTPEVVVEYVPPANTPAAPAITSQTHPDPNSWYSDSTAVLSWQLPTGVTEIRTLLDENPYTVPTKVYENPIKNIILEELPQGESYFHIQFRNADGWGKITHYRLGVDSQNPTLLKLSQPEPVDYSNPIQTIAVEAEDETSPVRTYKLKINDQDPFEVELEQATGTIDLSALEPGYHIVIVEAFDGAGNSIIETISITVESFDRPVFTEYPTELTPGVIPVIKGRTRPQSVVDVSLHKLGAESLNYTVTATEAGEFVFIPESALGVGVYEISAVATDAFGAQSETSEIIRLAVQEAGYVRIGGIVVGFLSVLIPIVALLLLSALLLLWFWRRAKNFRRSVRIESSEALSAVQNEFTSLVSTLKTQEAELRASRKTKKLTKAEAAMLASVRKTLENAQRHIAEEVTDVKELTD